MLRYGLITLMAALLGCASAGSASDDLDSPGAAPGHGGSGGQSGRTNVAGGQPSSAAGGGTAPVSGSSGTSNGGTSGKGAAGGNSASASGRAGDSGNHTNPLSQDLIDAFVKAHNDARAGNLVPTPSPPLPPVTWDAVLADTAYNYLSKCSSADGVLVDHNATRTKEYAALGGTGYVGENIYASSASTVGPADAVSSWMSEAPDYVAGDVTSAGHYTQVVWRASVRIGCAIVNCPSVRFHNTVLCDYAPGGNISGEMPY